MEINNEMRVEHILQAIAEIENFTRDLDEKVFCSDKLIQGFVLHRLMIVGEAAGRITVAYQEEHPEVPWRIMKNTRNVITHEYFGVKLNIVWDTIKKDLPPLKQALLKLEKT